MSKTDRSRLLVALLLLLVVDIIFFFLARPLFWVESGDTKAMLIGRFIGAFGGAFMLAAIVRNILGRWGRQVSLLHTAVFAVGLVAIQSGSHYVQEALSHYDPSAEIWSGMVNGCASTCYQAGQSAEVCSSGCECAARKFLGESSRLEVNRLLAQMISAGPHATDAWAQLQAIGQKCAQHSPVSNP
jgi:hypothetical protein